MNIKERLNGDLLEITVTIQLRKSIAEAKKYFSTNDLLEVFDKKYNIEKVISAPPAVLSNSRGGGKSQTGDWVLKIKEKTTKKTTRKRTTGAKPKPTQRKTIRNRMSDIATKKEKPAD